MSKIKNVIFLAFVTVAIVAPLTLITAQEKRGTRAKVKSSKVEMGGQQENALGAIQSRKQPQALSSFKSILAKVPDKSRRDFLQSLVFMHGGLAGAYIGDLESRLTPEEYRQLMGHLGVGPGGDHKGYSCMGKGDCAKIKNHICTSNCYAGDEPPISFRTMLRTVPEDQQTRFLESLDFVNGRLVNAYVGGIRVHLGQAEFDRLFSSLGVDTNQLRPRIKNDYYRQ